MELRDVDGGHVLEVTKVSTVPVQVDVKGLFSRSPKLMVQVPVASDIVNTQKKVTSLVEDLAGMTEKIKSSRVVETMVGVLEKLKEVTNKVFLLGESYADVFTSIEFILDMITGVGSLISMITVALTPISVLSGLYTVYKLIRSIMSKLPVVYRTVVEFIQPEEVFFDTTEMFAEAGAGINIVYSFLITMLPGPVRGLLDSFQKYTRVKILEDLDWIYQLADVVLHVPVYVMEMVTTGLNKLPQSAWRDTLILNITMGISQFEKLLAFVPELTTNRISKKMAYYLERCHADRRLLAKSDFLKEIGSICDDAAHHMVVLRSSHGTVHASFAALHTELVNFHRSGLALTQESHPEPVAILLWSRPGAGKTVFTQKCRQYWTGAGKNTVYDYTPTDGRSDFHDQYHEQNVWIHEDIGQRGENDWSQYIMHVGVNPSRMDGAALDKKSTIFFRSQVILGTTNIPIQTKCLNPVKGCGWTDADAIYRRWWVVAYERDKSDCVVYQYDVPKRVWRQSSTTMDCSDPKAFCDAVRLMYQDNVLSHQQLVTSYPHSADYCLAEGRTIGTKLEKVSENEVVMMVEEPQFVHPRFQSVHYVNGSEVVNFNEIEQERILATGQTINGGTETVGTGPVFVGSTNEWMVHLRERFDVLKTKTIDGLKAAFEVIQTVYGTLRDQIPKEYWIGAGLFTGLSILTGALVAAKMSKEKSKTEEYEPFLHWAKSNKKMSARELYAEGHHGLTVDAFPNETLKHMAKNVLECTFSYDGMITTSQMIMIDSQRGVVNAHVLLETKAQPKEVFVKGRAGNGQELLSAFMVIEKWDLEEDMAVLRYKNPHVCLFRSWSKAMSKTPSSTEMFMLLPNGVVPMGVPDRYEILSGSYQNRTRLFTSREGFYHRYDGRVSVAPGLCGAPVLTLDGYVIGWHVAGFGGRGYVRFWNKAMKEFVYAANSDADLVVAPSDFLGAIKLEDSTYHHVTLKSGIVRSEMFDPMMESSELSREGQPIRVPAELGGKRIENGEEIRTYDASRKKNLIVPELPVDMRALNFATVYINELISSVVPGRIPVLSDFENVKGLRRDGLVIKGVNVDASAGVGFSGVVGDWVDKEKGVIHERVQMAMKDLEKKARSGVKNSHDAVFKDCNKDELRNLNKAKKPRCFSAGPVHFTLLIRKWVGALQAMFMKHRMRTGVMIGINATSAEWKLFWEHLQMNPNQFDGDFENWDGGMRKEFQERLNRVISDYSMDPQLVLTLLMHLCETLHVGMDMSYLTNHSVPSGHGITALYNSLINKMYSAYAWYILRGRHMNLPDDKLVKVFIREVWSPVYGDDVIVTVANEAKEQFNAISFAGVMVDLGLGFTTATKQAHDRPFMPLRDITFLKRKFVRHHELRYKDRDTVVGPLDIDVLRSSCAFVHDKGRDQEITAAKVNSIQRELYLHGPAVYSTVWNEIKRCYYTAFDMSCPELTRQEMQSMYWAGTLRDDLFEKAESRVITRRSTKRTLRWR